VGCVFEGLQAVVEDHRQEEKELDGEYRIIAWSKLKSSRHSPRHEVEHPGNEYQVDRDPREGLQRPPSLIQGSDRRARRQAVDPGRENEQEKADPPDPEGERD